ncbi:MAG: hypothetical protein ACRC62_01320 [Microcoleus sp.]
MPRGGWRGGVKPHAWLFRSGEPAKLTRLAVPEDLRDDVKTIAHMFDRGELSLDQVLRMKALMEGMTIEQLESIVSDWEAENAPTPT